ncbi:MAG: outer membrane beta-barrel protein [Gemmataceae bacterium]
MKSLQGTSLGDFLDARKTTVSGFVDLRYTATNVGSLNRLPAGMGYSFNPDVPQFNWVTVNRAVDKESKEASFGYEVDLILFGSNYQFTLARDLFSNQLTANNGRPNPYGVDVPEFYAEWYFPNVFKGLDVQVGRRYARFGIESLNPIQTVLPSYSYDFIYNPYTYTGVMLEANVTDNITVTSDFTLGPDVWFGDSARFFWLGAVHYYFTKKTFVRGAVFIGDNRYDAARGQNYPAFVDVDFVHKFGDQDKWTFSSEYTYGWQRDVPGIGYAKWYSFANYLTYAWTDKFATTGRVEFFDDVDGQRTGFKGLYSSFTVGNTWRPNDWLMFRPEVRYDYNNQSLPFDGRSNFFGVTLNGIILW